MNEATADSNETVNRFRLDGITEHLKRIWAAMHGGDPDGPRDYDPFADERRFYQNLLREQRNGGHGSVGGNQKAQFIIGILITINIAMTGAFSSWVVSAIANLTESQAEQGKDIAVIKCRIDPSCRVVVSSDKP